LKNLQELPLYMEFARRDPGGIQQLIHQLELYGHVAFHDGDRFLRSGFSRRVALQYLEPPLDDIEWRSQFVRQRCHKPVLRAARVTGLDARSFGLIEELQPARVSLLNAHIHAVILRGANVGVQNLDVLKLWKRPKGLCGSRIGVCRRKIGSWDLVDAVGTTRAVRYRQAVAEGGHRVRERPSGLRTHILRRSRFPRTVCPSRAGGCT